MYITFHSSIHLSMDTSLFSHGCTSLITYRVSITESLPGLLPDLTDVPRTDPNEALLTYKGNSVQNKVKYEETAVVNKKQTGHNSWTMGAPHKG